MHQQDLISCLGKLPPRDNAPVSMCFVALNRIESLDLVHDAHKHKAEVVKSNSQTSPDTCKQPQPTQVTDVSLCFHMLITNRSLQCQHRAAVDEDGPEEWCESVARVE